MLYYFIIAGVTLAFGYALFQEWAYRLRERERKDLYEQDKLDN